MDINNLIILMMAATFAACLGFCLTIGNFENARNLRYRRELDESFVNDLQSVLSKARREDGVLNPSGLLHEYLHDPLVVPNFNVTNSGTFTDVKGDFWNMTLSGLRGSQIHRIKVNLGDMNATIVMYIPVLRLDGEYSLDGSVTFFTISGNGEFWMNVTHIVVLATTTVLSKENGKFEVGEIGVNVDVEDIKLHFNNLMGGGAWSSITNSLLNQMSNLIFDEVKHSILDELKDDLKKEIDKQLSEIPEDLISGESTNILDEALHQASLHMKSNGVDPLSLPDHKETIQRQMVFFTAHGELRLTNGILHGLSTIHRSGDVIVTYEENAIVLEANIGFENITGGYTWNAHLLGVGPYGNATISVREIAGYIQIRQELRTGSKPQLDSFKITKIRQIWVDISGLGTWDFIFEIIVNLVTNSLKFSLASAITGPVQRTIQQELDNMPLPLL